jgi:hypothetical protein
MSDKEKKKEFDKRYYEKNREKKIAKSMAYYYKNKDKWKLYQKQWYKKRMEKLDGLIGDTCFICNSKEHICFHEKHGLNHEYHGSYGYHYYLEHHKDFIPLCFECHRLVHGLKRNMDRTKLEYVISLFL